MFDIAWSELAVIGAIALVVIGPKDLPKVMRTAGQWSRKMRTLSNEFRRNIDDMVRQAELDEIRRKAESNFDFTKEQSDLDEAMNGGNRLPTLEEITAEREASAAAAATATTEASAEFPPPGTAEDTAAAVAAETAPAPAPHVEESSAPERPIPEPAVPAHAASEPVPASPHPPPENQPENPSGSHP